MKAQFNIGDSPEETYRGGMEYYSTMLHEMTHSTMTPERLNREMGGRFGDPKYAKEELVAELTAAMISHSMGFDSRITDNSAAYLDSWIGVLKQEPKFIVSVMADVNKASDLILDHVDKQRLALGEQPYLAKKKHPFHHSQVERNDMGTFTSFDYTLLVTDELVDEILALGDKVEITFPEKLRMKLLQKIGRIRNRYAT